MARNTLFYRPHDIYIVISPSTTRKFGNEEPFNKLRAQLDSWWGSHWRKGKKIKNTGDSVTAQRLRRHILEDLGFKLSHLQMFRILTFDL